MSDQPHQFSKRAEAEFRQIFLEPGVVPQGDRDGFSFVEPIVDRHSRRQLCGRRRAIRPDPGVPALLKPGVDVGAPDRLVGWRSTAGERDHET
ncbi:MAG: hypothetical protein HY736_05835 [Verrucomicrobia bacterium]|nr:hypothetical protein [Verrucomicrobiota bacterium]